MDGKCVGRSSVEIIIKCFRHVGMYPDEQERMNADEDDDSFAGDWKLIEKLKKI